MDISSMVTNVVSLGAWIALMFALDAFFNVCLMAKSYVENKCKEKFGK